ncbi:hypothetical protein UB44_16980 [Burkholderiaceae bacterium 26]|nr:hypothetical protein UB44_16980 [Burkholderiaceae bacterium 26]
MDNVLWHVDQAHQFTGFAGQTHTCHGKAAAAAFTLLGQDFDEFELAERGKVAIDRALVSANALGNHILVGKDRCKGLVLRNEAAQFREGRTGGPRDAGHVLCRVISAQDAVG